MVPSGSDSNFFCSDVQGGTLEALAGALAVCLAGDFVTGQINHMKSMKSNETKGNPRNPRNSKEIKEISRNRMKSKKTNGNQRTLKEAHVKPKETNEILKKIKESSGKLREPLVRSVWETLNLSFCGSYRPRC